MLWDTEKVFIKCTFDLSIILLSHSKWIPIPVNEVRSDLVQTLTVIKSIKIFLELLFHLEIF